MARHRGDKFSELLRESAGEARTDDEWLVRLHQAQEASVGDSEVNTSEDYSETAGQWPDLALDGDLAREVALAMERLEGCLSDLDQAVTRAKAASRDTRSLVERLRGRTLPAKTGPQTARTKRPPGAVKAAATKTAKAAAKKTAKAAAKKTAKKSSSGSVKAQGRGAKG